MSPRFVVEIAIGLSLGVVVAYLLAGGASYEPLRAADPCDPRSQQILAERGVFEGIVLSGLDGAACELGVSREELSAALADEAALRAFAAEHEISEERVNEAVRAGLVRAVDDAESQGRLTGLSATAARFIAENAPADAALDAFRALPGEPSVPEVLEQLQQLDLSFDDFLGSIDDLGSDILKQLNESLDALGGSSPDGSSQPPEGVPLPEGVPGLDQLGSELERLQEQLQQQLQEQLP